MILIAAAALAAQALPGQPDLDWMAGYWLSCDARMEVAEYWTTRRGGVMLGGSITYGTQAFGWEQVRIETTLDGATMQYVARPRGAEADTVFRLARAGPNEAAFENPAHDYPQRIVYRRQGDVLIARTEDMAGGNGQDFRYRAAPLNARCPASRRR
jgi:Domain of unknown function (DUF6265)